MFNIILIVEQPNKLLDSNIKTLQDGEIDCNILVLNILKDPIQDIKGAHVFNICTEKYNAINKVVSGLDGDVVILDTGIGINKHFLTTLSSNYDPSVLNLFRTDTIRDVVVVDNRLGRINGYEITLCMAFNTDLIQEIYPSEKFNKILSFQYIKVVLKQNIRVFRHKVKVKPNKSLRQVSISRTSKRITELKKASIRQNEDKILKKQLKKINSIDTELTFSIIIPFMYNGDRFPLFEASIKCLHEYFKDNNNVEIIVHETAPERYLSDDFIKKYNIVYMYSEWNEVFHRAWALNIPAKHIATGDIFVFFDADLIITDEWVNELFCCDISNVYIGWGKMVNLTDRSTSTFLKTGNIINEYERIRYPNPNAAAGGINIIPKSIFFSVCGWDESFEGTYGGEDNVMFCKLQKLGYKPNNYFKSQVYHLFHGHRTYKNPKRFMIFRKLSQWDRSQWNNHIKSVKWGDLSRLTLLKSNVSKMVHKQEIKMTDLTKKLNILWCRVNTDDRVAGHLHYIVDEVKTQSNLTVFERDVKKHPAKYQQEMLSISGDNVNIDRIIDNQCDYDCIIIQHSFAFSTTKWDKINIPVFMLYEDQHDDNNRYQLELAIKYGWVVLSRYKLKDFNDDINKKVKKCLWLPHNINTDVFKDYNLEKERMVLQTGAIYSVYETRVFINNFFKNEKLSDNWYRYIKRPKEDDKNKWPVGVDYAKEINKSWLTVCCGSKYEYPVMKYFEIPACNSIIYGDYFDELGDLGFIPDENMIVVDKTDIMGQLHSLRANKNFLYDIMHNGKNLIKEHYTIKNGVLKLIQHLRDNI